MGNIFPTFDGQEWFLVHQSSVRGEIVQVQNPGGFDSWKSSEKTAKRTTNPPKKLANTQKINDWRLPNKNTKHYCKNQGKSRKMTSSWTSVINHETIYYGTSWQNDGTSGYNKNSYFSWEKNMKTHPTCFDVKDHPTWKVVTLVIVSPRFVGYTVLLMAKLTHLPNGMFLQALV